MLIGIDWDGTLVHRTGVPTNSNPWSDKPKKYAIETIRLFIKNGIEFYIFTNRNKTQWVAIKEWWQLNNFPKVKDLLVTNIKQPGTTIYLDDRAVRFTDWNDFRKLIL